MRRSPLEDVYRSAHWMYATGSCSTLSSSVIWTANALSGSTCGSSHAPSGGHVAINCYLHPCQACRG